MWRPSGMSSRLFNQTKGLLESHSLNPQRALWYLHMVKSIPPVHCETVAQLDCPVGDYSPTPLHEVVVNKYPTYIEIGFREFNWSTILDVTGVVGVVGAVRGGLSAAPTDKVLFYLACPTYNCNRLITRLDAVGAIRIAIGD